MKKTIFMLVCLVATLCASAQTTGSLYPQNKSVYVPETYNNIMEVSYDNLINASNAKVVLSVGTESSVLTPTNVTEYGFNLDILATLQKMGKAKDNTVFTVKVSNVLPADTIINVDPDFEGEIETPTQNTYVEDVEGIYLLRSAYPTATANPAEGAVLNSSENAAVNVTFSEAIKVADIFFMSGSRRSQTVNRVDGPAAPVMELTAEILPEYWNTSITPSTMEVRLADATITVDGIEWIIPDFVFNYTAAAEQKEVKYLGCDPAPGTMTAWEVYNDGWGFVEFIFDGEVQLTNADKTARVTYTTDDDVIVFDVSSAEAWGDWSWWDNNYHVEIPLPYDPSINEDNLESVQITLYGVMANDLEINVKTITFTSTVNSSMKMKQVETAGIADLNITGNELVVYNLQGVKVGHLSSSHDINLLPKGVYIINGKKIRVK